jgi:uncharacterized phage infection (PIP) family protein YhgE|tara:strand:+ start:15494 stop:16354 length:861 start_codon:yes stop_codon:yes gene_type:complete
MNKLEQEKGQLKAEVKSLKIEVMDLGTDIKNMRNSKEGLEDAIIELKKSKVVILEKHKEKDENFKKASNQLRVQEALVLEAAKKTEAEIEKINEAKKKLYEEEERIHKLLQKSKEVDGRLKEKNTLYNDKKEVLENEKRKVNEEREVINAKIEDLEKREAALRENLEEFKIVRENKEDSDIALKKTVEKEICKVEIGRENNTNDLKQLETKEKEIGTLKNANIAKAEKLDEREEALIAKEKSIAGIMQGLETREKMVKILELRVAKARKDKSIDAELKRLEKDVNG